MKQELLERRLPDLMTMNDGTSVTPEKWPQRKQELLDCLQKNLYGYTPEAPKEVRAEILGSIYRFTIGGKAKAEEIKLSFDTPGGEYSFKIRLVIPKKFEKPPVFLVLNFGPLSPMPLEEIMDNGFAYVDFFYEDIERDAKAPEHYFANFKGGLGEKFFGGRKRTKTEWGKVGLWAYGASRVMDYLQTRDDINTERIGVVGHSRLGKTALWCKAQDPRFYVAFGNDSNYGGGGLIRGHIGEDIPLFLELGSYDFFCEGWKDFVDVPHEDLPFDQHFLMAAHAPGLVYLAGATGDAGMDPKSEFLSCLATNPVYEMLGQKGLVCDDKMPAVGEGLYEGNVGFHYRAGGHAFSREDWLHYMAFFKKHL